MSINHLNLNSFLDLLESHPVGQHYTAHKDLDALLVYPKNDMDYNHYIEGPFLKFLLNRYRLDVVLGGDNTPFIKVYGELPNRGG